MDYGFYNLSDKSYTSIGVFDGEISASFTSADAFDGEISAGGKDYLVLKKFDGDYAKTSDGDDSVRLYLYDIAAKKFKLIFTYSFDRYDEFFKYHYQNGIVIKDGKIYFDDVIDDFSRVILYEYDIETSKLTEIARDALDPHIYKDKVVYRYLKDDVYTNFRSIDGSIDFSLDKKYTDIYLGESIVALEYYFNDDFSAETIKSPIYYLHDYDVYADSGDFVMTTERTIADMEGGGDFLAFVDYMHEIVPTVYNVKTHELIVFDEFEPVTNNRYVLGDNVGVVCSSGEYYFFQYK